MEDATSNVLIELRKMASKTVELVVAVEEMGERRFTPAIAVFPTVVKGFQGLYH
jgi:hypothetical protein